MEKIKFKDKKIQGVVTRTKNSNEMKPETAKIGALWHQFHQQLAGNLTPKSTVYGVYFDYESDYRGEFSVLAGADHFNQTAKLETINIADGEYLLFKGTGPMPEVVIQVWQDVWNYFSNSSVVRSYQTDFELYRSGTEVEVYIGINSSLT